MTKRQHTLRALGWLAVAVTTAASAGAVALANHKERERVRVSMPDSTHSSVVVFGCRAEDDCAIDYRNGRWVLRRLAPHEH